MPRKKKVKETQQFDVTMSSTKPGISQNTNAVTKTISASNPTDATRIANQGDPQAAKFDQVMVTKKVGTGMTPNKPMAGSNSSTVQNPIPMTGFGESLVYPYSIMLPAQLRKVFEGVKSIQPTLKNGKVYAKLTEAKQMNELIKVLEKRDTAHDRMILSGIKGSSK